ncbi:MAG: hypothetical protein WC142_03730 [Bacteroidales bacterium]|jgi:hypothetical protein|nr:hypothetical protein [Bacteroidales bacterium]MDD2687690.1 hypothetical protein [Bacteroidales bacterium]MDD3331180.1 hypothetical protein [Bacteroidales bacterium]MDD3691905.1 hypothetical protein [Bacteroidales bacterium]MDD4044611.1 hypothetical protein [Bacteroidales bacterium]
MKCIYNYKHILLFLASLLMLSCQNKEKQLHNKLKQSIEDYISKDFSADTRLDSIVILSIDSLTEYHFENYILKPVIENRIEELSFQYNHLSDDKSFEELALKQKTENQINALVDKLLYIQNDQQNNKVDSIQFKYFFVNALIYTYKNNEPTQEYYGFPITTDFQIREINELVFE